MALYSYNGWLASKNPEDFGGLVNFVVAGETFSPGVRTGDVGTVLKYVAEQLHKRVEPIDKGHSADDWGYSFRPNTNNPSQLSCHGSGTAFDYNATRHPNGRRDTFTAAQVREIKKILAEVDNVVAWLEGYDEMHFEICANAAKVGVVARRLRGEDAQPVPKRPVLKLGSGPEGAIGAAVKLVQGALKTNYPAYAGHLVVDGDFGKATEAALIEFQQRSGLQADGVVGPKTYTALGL